MMGFYGIFKLNFLSMNLFYSNIKNSILLIGGVIITVFF